MKLTHLDLDKFCAFRKAEFDFSPGINVFIGANATGKTHLMKLLYCVLRARRDANGVEPGNKEVGILLAQKLGGVFRPDRNAIGRLVHRAVGKNKATVALTADTGDVSFRVTTQGNLYVDRDTLTKPEPSIFIPSREVLAMYEGFVKAYEDRELSFDETYRDVCVALSGTPLRGPRLAEVRKLAAPLQEILGGRVSLDGGRFYLAATEGNLEAHLLSEGLRKIGSLLHLIVNGSLMKNGFLFWDEPEANLNPQLVTKVVGTLRHLALFGVQVFVASHDYLLTQHLALPPAKGERRAPVRFFCFNRDEEAGIKVDQGDTIAALASNPILDEFARYYDRQRDSFTQAAE